MPEALNQESHSRSRVLSIDVLRGLTIALMILVNDPGDWSHVYSQLDHAEWNGFTLTDFVFPNFLFLVGFSLILSLESRIARGQSRRILALHMVRRAATIFAIKMFLSAFPHFHMTHLRLYGVLTRIALCYLAAGLILLLTRRPRTLLAITVALLVGYWSLMRFVPVPGLGLPNHADAIPTHAIPILDPDRNLAAWLDRAVNAFTRRWLHTGSLYNHTRDPEGLLSTLPAIATTLIGAVTALWMRRVDTTRLAARNLATEDRRPQSDHHSPNDRQTTSTQCLTGLIVSGLASLATGLIWNHWFPINKNLWTSSYVFFSAGWSLLLLALCYWLIDIRRANETRAGKRLLFPWLVFGSNAIFAFVLSNLIVQIMLWIKVPSGALVNPADPTRPITAWLWTYRHIFARHHSSGLTSLAFAVAFTALCFLPTYVLWRKRIFLKI
jgi:predicted acyltransferase